MLRIDSAPSRPAALACAFLVAASVAATPVAAQRRTRSDDAQARTYFERGRVAYDDERYEEALAAFQQAYSLSERAALLYNIGQCADRIGRRDLAIDAFERYLDALPDASNRVEVATRLELLREHVQRPPADDATREPRPAPTEPQEQGGGSVFTQAWFWVLVGCLVAVGAGVAIGVAVASAPGDTAQPPRGDVGVGGIVFALGGP